MNTEDQSQNKKTELENEIARLEALAEPSPEDVDKVEKLKDQLAEIQALDLSAIESSGIHFRSLTDIELKRLAEFAARSPGFAKLPVEEKVDRLALAVTQGFGFGSFNADLLRQGSKAFSIPEDFPFDSYLEAASSGESQAKNKYSNVGKKSFKMDRLYLTELLGLATASEQGRPEEPIRKKVQASPQASKPVAPQSVPRSAAPPRRPVPKDSQPVVHTAAIPRVESSQSLAAEAPVSEGEKTKKHWLVPALAIGLVAILSALFLVLA